MEPARVGQATAKLRHGLTEAKLRELQPGERASKVSDGGSGLYVVISPSGSRSFRYDYRLSGRRETLTIGRHVGAMFSKLTWPTAWMRHWRKLACFRHGHVLKSVQGGHGCPVVWFHAAFDFS